MVKTRAYINFPGTAEKAFTFYKSVFGGDFSSVIRFKDFPIPGVPVKKADENKIMHMALPVGKDQILMASDVAEPAKLVQGNSVYVFLEPDSKTEADRIFKALSAGGEMEMPLATQPWGDYYGSFKDKFGVMWMVNYSQPRPK